MEHLSVIAAQPNHTSDILTAIIDEL